MSDQHEHPNSAPQRQVSQRQPKPETVIEVLNQKLTERASAARAAEDREAWCLALISDLEAEVAGLTAALDQINTENHRLRIQLDLPATGALDLPAEPVVIDAPDVDPPSV